MTKKSMVRRQEQGEHLKGEGGLHGHWEREGTQAEVSEGSGGRFGQADHKMAVSHARERLEQF